MYSKFSVTKLYTGMQLHDRSSTSQTYCIEFLSSFSQLRKFMKKHLLWKEASSWLLLLIKETWKLKFSFGQYVLLNPCYNSMNGPSEQRCTKTKVFHWGFLQYLWANSQFSFTFSEEILNKKLHFFVRFKWAEYGNIRVTTHMHEIVFSSDAWNDDHIKYRFLKSFSEAVAPRCSVKNMFLEISQNSQENTCRSLFFNKVEVEAKFLKTHFFFWNTFGGCFRIL